MLNNSIALFFSELGAGGTSSMRTIEDFELQSDDIKDALNIYPRNGS